MSRNPEDPRDITLPAGWRSWGYRDRSQYLTVNLSRADLFRAIVLCVDPDERDAQDVDRRSRFRKDELAYMALRLGMFKL